MIEEWLIAAAAILAALVVLAYLPKWFDHRAASYKSISALTDEFYTSANKLASDKQTPVGVLQLLGVINAHFADPKVIRAIVWSAIRGRLTEHAERPPEKARAFMRAFNEMPDELQKHFATAVVCSLLASSEKSALFGFIFVRMMLFNPTAQKQKQSDAPTYATEIASLEGDFVPA